ncbi:MAG: hypothetical protein WAK33_02090, partial [Silvibacterium sp.]
MACMWHSSLTSFNVVWMRQIRHLCSNAPHFDWWRQADIFLPICEQELKKSGMAIGQVVEAERMVVCKVEDYF